MSLIFPNQKSRLRLQQLDVIKANIHKMAPEQQFGDSNCKEKVGIENYIYSINVSAKSPKNVLMY